MLASFKENNFGMLIQPARSGRSSRTTSYTSNYQQFSCHYLSLLAKRKVSRVGTV
jgi:hypothetical protein